MVQVINLLNKQIFFVLDMSLLMERIYLKVGSRGVA